MSHTAQEQLQFPASNQAAESTAKTDPDRFGLRDLVRWLAWSGTLGLFGGLLVLGVAKWQFGSVAATEAWLNGHVVYVEPLPDIPPVVRPGEKAILSFSIRNLTSEPITILEAGTSCSCAAANDLPIQIGPSEKRIVSFTVHANSHDAGSTISESSRLNIHPIGRPITVRLSARVISDDNEGT